MSSESSAADVGRRFEYFVARLAAAGVTFERTPTQAHNFRRGQEREVALCAPSDWGGPTFLDRRLRWSVAGRSGAEVHLDDRVRCLRGATCLVAYATAGRPDVLRICSGSQLCDYERALVDYAALATHWRCAGSTLSGYRVATTYLGRRAEGFVVRSEGLDDAGGSPEPREGRLLVALRVLGTVEAWYPREEVEILGPLVEGWERPSRTPQPTAALPSDAASVACGGGSR